MINFHSAISINPNVSPMIIEISAKTKHKIIICCITAFACAIGLGLYRDFGESEVLEVNIRNISEISKIKLVKDLSDQIFKPMLLPTNYNIFIFDKGEMKAVKKRIRKKNELKMLKIAGKTNRMTGDYLYIGNSIMFTRIRDSSWSKIVLVDYDTDNLSYVNSFSGRLYELTGGYSIVKTIKNISKILNSFKKKTREGYFGVAFIRNTGLLFFYDIGKEKVTEMKEFRGLEKQIYPFEIFSVFLGSRME